MISVSFVKGFVNMEHYKKGKNVEEPLTKEVIPIPKLPENFLWMQVIHLIYLVFFSVKNSFSSSLGV